jgi:hypothetical protein
MIRHSNPPAVKKANRHRWLFERLEDQPTFEARKMFGALAAYFNGMLVLVLADGDEPWRGVLVPTERESHAALMAEFPALASHPVLGKWLYLPESATSFERDAEKLVECIRRLDARIGVLPEKKRPKKRPAR